MGDLILYRCYTSVHGFWLFLMVGNGLTVLGDMGYLLHNNHLMFSVGEVLLLRPYNVQTVSMRIIVYFMTTI